MEISHDSHLDLSRISFDIFIGWLLTAPGTNVRPKASNFFPFLGLKCKFENKILFCRGPIGIYYYHYDKIRKHLLCNENIADLVIGQAGGSNFCRKKKKFTVHVFNSLFFCSVALTLKKLSPSRLDISLDIFDFLIGGSVAI